MCFASCSGHNNEKDDSYIINNESVDSVLISFFTAEGGTTIDVLITRDHATLVEYGENLIISKLDHKMAQMLYGFIDDMFISKRSEIYLFKKEFDEVMMSEPCILDIYVSNKDYSKRIYKQFYTSFLDYNQENQVDTVENMAVKYSDTFRKLVSSMLSLSQEYEMLNSFQTEKYRAPWEIKKELISRKENSIRITLSSVEKKASIDIILAPKISMFVGECTLNNNHCYIIDSIPDKNISAIKKKVDRLFLIYEKEKDNLNKTYLKGEADGLNFFIVTLPQKDKADARKLYFWFNDNSVFLDDVYFSPVPKILETEILKLIRDCQLLGQSFGVIRQ